MNICVETDKRLAYLTVLDDGSLSLLNEKPKKCSKIKTTESYLRKAWEKVNNGEIVSYKEVKKNVEILWRVKMKAMYAGTKIGVKESFS